MASTMPSLSDAMKLQKKLDTLALMVEAARAFSIEISETYATELQHSDTKFVNHLLEVANQEINKVIHAAQLHNPFLQTLQRSASNRSTASSDSNCSDETLQRKRAKSAAEREKVQDLQEIRERLAKVLHYRAPSRSAKAAVKGEETK